MKQLFDCIINSRIIIFSVWLIATLSLAVFALLYESKTSMYFAPPKGSPSKHSIELVNASFANLTHQEPFALMVSRASKSNSTLCETTDEALLQTITSFNEKAVALLKQNTYFLKSADYFDAKKNYPGAAFEFCKNDSFIIQAVFNTSWNGLKEVKIIRQQVKDLFNEVFKNNKEFKVSFISMSCLFKDVIDGTLMDMAKLDSISIVLGFVVVALFTKHLSLLVISLVNLAFSFVISFGISYFVACFMDVVSFSSAVQSATCVALTFDYSLFLFSSIKRDISLGKPANEIISNMLKSSGHVILISGACLALVFLLMMVCPINAIQSIGLVNCITIVVIFSVSITNTAALLALFPKFFLGEKFDFWKTDYLNPKRIKIIEDLDAEPLVADSVPLKETCYAKNCTTHKNQIVKEAKIQTAIKSLFSKFISKKWISIVGILIVAAVSLAFTYPFIKMDYSIDIAQTVPRNSPTLTAISEFGNEYGNGLLEPYYVVFNKTSPTVNSLLDQTAFTLMQKMAQEFIDVSKQFTGNLSYLQINSSQVIAPFFFNKPISVREFTLMNKTHSFQFMMQQVAPHPEDLSVFSMMLTPNIPMTGKGADKFIPVYRKVINKYEPEFKQLGIQITEYGMECAMIDAINGLFDGFPMVIGITCGVIFLVLCVAFKSFIAPIRLLVEVFLLQIFYFGIATLIFQFGHVHGNDALLWATIFVMFSVSVGLACDYDIFSFDSIYQHFYENQKQALNEGYVINFRDCVLAASDNLLTVMTAGIIMIVSFSGLMLSSIDMLLQFGTCLVFDLAFDTFVVVPILVPAFSYLFGEKNMYPGNAINKKKILKGVLQAQE
ncbi:MmpL_efflux pump [Hexamita inflata]|uniref:Putative n=1 Tax=Hexamita inflata TaxID=28002 RepID=A0AA86TF39_9EUKA|nr:MmpL efflux pump [Hexamita inflata]